MTCIVGIVDGKDVYIGGDSAGVAGLSLTVRADRKVFRNGDFLFGFTSSFRMGQLLAHSFTPPKRYSDDDVDKYMVTTFIDGVRACLKTGGFAEKSNEAEQGGTFLVGYQGRLFKIESDYQVGFTDDGYDACGCGEQIALGNLFATKPFMKPIDRVMMALAAAEQHSAGVRGPFHVEKLKGGK